MSVDISLGQLDFDGYRINTDDDIEVGNFPSDMMTIWNWAFAKVHEVSPKFPIWFGAAHHQDCALFADYIGLALGELFNPACVSNYDPEFYTAAVFALTKVWKACRDNPDYHLILSY